MRELEESNVNILCLAESLIGIMIIDSPCVEHVSIICKVAVSRNSDLPHCRSRKKVFRNQYAIGHLPLPRTDRIALDLKRAQRAREDSLKLRRPQDYSRRPV